MILFGFCNVNWGGNLDTKNSTTYFAFLLNNVIVIWSSQKQQTMALSTTEIEYMATSQTNYEAIWLQRFLNELSSSQKEATTISINN
jgi:protoheme ferro-lyase